MHPIAFGVLDELVDELRSLRAGLSVDLAPSRVNPPGIWVAVRSIRSETLASTTFRLRLHIVGPATEVRAAMGVLEELHNLLVPVVNTLGGPTGDTEVAALGMPDGSTLPALVIPLDLSTS